MEYERQKTLTISLSAGDLTPKRLRAAAAAGADVLLQFDAENALKLARALEEPARAQANIQRGRRNLFLCLLIGPILQLALIILL